MDTNKPADPPIDPPVASLVELPVADPIFDDGRPKRRTGIIASDIDAQGNVTVWDHGPQEPHDLDPKSEEANRIQAEAKEWHRRNGDAPVPTLMHASEATNAMTVDPLRYSIDPLDADDPDVQAKVKEIVDAREVALKASAEHAARAQYFADLKQATTAVLADRKAKAAEAKAKE